MILTGSEIKRQVKRGDIKINPYDEKLVQPNSYDITLAPTIFRVFAKTPKRFDVKSPVDHEQIEPLIGNHKAFGLSSNECYLATHQQQIWAPELVMMLHGRSTVARYFLQVHLSAGFGDLGFGGYWTMELVPTKNVIVYVGMSIAQISFHTTFGNKSMKYEGRYTTDMPVPKLPIPIEEPNSGTPEKAENTS